MRYTIVSFLVFCVSCSSMYAQSEAGKSKQPRLITEISVVALGAKPQRRYKESKGAESPIMIMSKPGQTPPSRLYYEGKTKGETKATWKTFNIPFNNPSTMREIPPGQELILHRKLPKDAGYERYVTIPAGAEGSRRVFFLLTSTRGPTPWAKPPLVRTIGLDSASMKDKQFILKNLSRFTVLHAFEKSVISVAPMKTISYKRAKTGQLYRLAAQYGTEKQIIYNTAVRLNGDGHIQLYALYDANPRTNSSRSVGVFRTMIPARVRVPPLSPKPSTKPE